ncbi:MAG: ester cyclase [Pseudomonadota bacterium]
MLDAKTTATSEDFRSKTRLILDEILADPSKASARLTPDSSWHIAHPVNHLVGPDAIAEGFLKPLAAALTQIERRDILFMGGTNRLHENGRWVAAITHYVGNFTAPLFGLKPSGSMIFLRSGEFYRLDEDGRIAEARIIFDMVDVMYQIRRMPIPSLGDEITWPAPATQDGLCPTAPYEGDAFDVVERMTKTLGQYTPGTFHSEGQIGEGGVWTDNMLWYGPGGIGSNYRWDGFVQDHRAPFLIAFPDRKGGHHYCRFGDSHYAAMGGWPSIHATFAEDYLGLKATGGPITMRVMDFYRIDPQADGGAQGGRLAENWVFIDLAELFAQCGRDLIAEANALA